MARKETDKRITLTVDADYYDKLKYIAEKEGVSLSELFREATDLYIRYKNEDYYPLAKLEAERINQILDHLIVLSTNVSTLEKIVINNFDSLLNLTKGDMQKLYEDDSESISGNYLSNEDENG